MKATLCVGLLLLATACAHAQATRPHAGDRPARPGTPVATGRHDGDRGYSHGIYRGDGYRRYRGPVVSVWPGYFGGYWGGAGYGFYDNAGYYGYSPALGYGYPSYAADGLWLGALAGGIIGHNSGSLGRDAWRGAAWGAGLGWLLGTVADANRVIAAPSPAVVAAPDPVQTVGAASAIAMPATVPAPPPSAMSAANALFGRN